ncbi:hypothetical protein OCU04_005394 [Sclerotinia nivalis]|uniref:Uncharacterized protein n=1 Tax=Sclerotinia nivalis TaxID=352851 RepID=A0A9X0DMR9_9HELO|nr:hypothetical protein OCU04_005394 [Sclerotinia nivalis]
MQFKSTNSLTTSSCITVRSHVQLNSPFLLKFCQFNMWRKGPVWYGVITRVRLNDLPCGFLCVTTGPMKERDTRRPRPTDSLISYIAANITQARGNQGDMGDY